MSAIANSEKNGNSQEKIVLLKSNRIQKFTLTDAILIFILSLFALTILYPFYNAVLVSLVPQQLYVRSRFMLWPPEIILDSYKFVFKSRLIWTSLFNSTIITFFGTAYNMILTVLCAYALTKPIPGRRFFRFLIIFTMYFSGGIIPYYLLIKDLKLMNTLAVMIIPTGIAIMYMLIISNYFKSLPPSLEESAKLDGASDITILIRIILPLSLPLLATFTLYYVVDRWNEWFSAMMFIRTTTKWPLQLTLRKIIQDANFANTTLVPGQVKPDTYGDSIKMASIVVTMFPMMMLYPFLQKYFLSGMMLGAVKE